MSDPIRLLGVSGSLRRASLNTALLDAAAGLLPDGVTLERFDLRGIPFFDADVQAVTSRPRAAVLARLADAGVAYVVLPAPADGTVAAGLDASGGLDQASAEDRSTRAWHVSRPVDENALDGPSSWLRTGLLVLQGVAILVVLVLCAPSTGIRRES